MKSTPPPPDWCRASIVVHGSRGARRFQAARVRLPYAIHPAESGDGWTISVVATGQALNRTPIRSKRMAVSLVDTLISARGEHHA